MSKRIRFGKTKLCFVRDGRKRCRGLTRILHSRFPVLTTEASTTTGKNRKHSEVMCKSKNDVEHGILVDQEIYYRTRYGQRAFERNKQATADGCTLGLLQHLENRGWEPVASQLAIYSKQMRLATAIDLLCTDTKTHKKLILVELKSTLDDPSSKQCRRSYEQSTGTMSDYLDNLPLSYYTQHQIQLWTMYHILSSEYRIPVSEAYVLRVGRGGSQALEYPLNPWFKQRSQKLLRTLSRFSR